MDQAQIDLEYKKLLQHYLLGEDVKDEQDLPFK